MVPNESKLLDMLSNNDVTFFIPPYQRNYEWTDEQCKVFWEDVKKTCERNIAGTNTEHFFGTITFFQSESVFGQPVKLVLIDGQQRITTTMLFLVALRDVLMDEGMKGYIDNKYLKNNNVQGDIEYKIKLKQVETDWEAYKKIILSVELVGNEKNSAVAQNYKYFKNVLSDYQKDGGNLENIIVKGLTKFSVIKLELQPEKNAWENPQEIFESMNSLGKPLSLADLVRNYLLLGLTAEEQDDLYRKYWLHIEQVIPGKVSDFVRDYMQAHEKKSFLKSTEANYKPLYSSFKKIFEMEDPKALLKDLSECASVYAYVLNGCGTDSKLIDAELSDLNVLGVTTAYSFMMVLLRTWKQGKFTAQNIVDILKTFKIYCLRRRILALGTAENKGFPLLVKQIDRLAGAADKKAEMFKILADQENNLRLPNDIELQRVLETMNFGNFKYCKFYLSLIEETITKSRPDQTDPNLQIEHIMPQTLSDEWRATLGDEAEDIHSELLNTIGNLTLIRHNQSLGNKTFPEKKVVYENNSGMQIAKEGITNRDSWGEKEIKSRTKWLIQYLLHDVLTIPDDMRRINNFRVEAGKRKHLSFQELQLIGEDIHFFYDSTIVAHVVSDKEVEFEGKRWRLSPLTKEIQTRRGVVSPSGAYQGAQYWAYDDLRLSDIM